MKENREALGIVCVIASAVLFGLMPLMARIAYAGGSNPYTVAFGRFLFGSAGLFVVICALPGVSIRLPLFKIRAIAILSFFYALMPVLLYSSYTMISSGLATTLHFTYPVVVMSILTVVYRKPPSSRQMISAALCVLGILVLNRLTAGERPLGMVLAAVSGMAYAVYIVLLKRSDLEDVHVMVLTFYVALFSAIYIGLFALLTGELTWSLTPTAWISEIALGLVATVIAAALFQAGVFMCGEVRSSLLSTFEPVTGVIVGVLVFHESLTVRSIIGMGMILAAVILLVKKE